MIIVTGAAGFIGSNLVGKLNKEGLTSIVIVDKFNVPAKAKNLENKIIKESVDREDFIQWLVKNHSHVEFVFHLGARTDTTEFNRLVFEELNTGYTRKVWDACTRYQIPLIYASSAATYGAGENGYDDSHDIVSKLKPLNPYGESKNELDKWALQQENTPPFWAGIKFFNVYGPNEYHKGRMASVIFHAFNQIRQTGKMKLFRSHHPDYKDGGQKRDFIYVRDVCEVLFHLYRTRPESGLYNLGTGRARTFLDLTQAVFAALQMEPVIEFIDTPEDIRDKYQYFTEARMDKLYNKTRYNSAFYSLEKGVDEYVKQYLIPHCYY